MFHIGVFYGIDVILCSTASFVYIVKQDFMLLFAKYIGI